MNGQMPRIDGSQLRAEEARVIVERQRGESSEREKIQEGMTSFATHYDSNERVRQVSVVLKQHGEKLFPNDRRLEKAEDRENPGGDDPVIVAIFLCYPVIS